jgi:TetR/AcrR family transcriptional regulator, repressor of fatR-cypB operon
MVGFTTLDSLYAVIYDCIGMNVHSCAAARRVSMDEDLKDKRTAILEATLELISEQGFQGTPMSQIAQKANTGVGTIYRYFPSKNDLINALYIALKLQMAHCILQCYTEDMPVHKAFKLILRGMIDYFIANPKVLSFAEQYLNSPLITAATREEGSRIVEPLNILFQHALQQDLLKPLSISMLGELIYGSMVALSKYYIYSGENEDRADLDAGIDAIWDMIRL